MSVDDIKNAPTRGGTRFEENCRETIDLSLNQSQCSGRWLNCNFFFQSGLRRSIATANASMFQVSRN